MSFTLDKWRQPDSFFTFWPQFQARLISIPADSLFPILILAFYSLFYLDFSILFLFGLWCSFSIWKVIIPLYFYFSSLFHLKFCPISVLFYWISILSNFQSVEFLLFWIIFLHPWTNRGLILDFFHIFIYSDN